MIKDSGNRTEFESGAVRDMQSGKGRCDLLPLDIIYNLKRLEEKENGRPEDPLYNVLPNLDDYLKTGNIRHVENALIVFIKYRAVKFEDAILELAKHYEDGCQKYGENNWRKGIPAHCYVDSAVRHLLKYLRDDTDEDHDRAFVWNLVCLLWTVMNKPDMNDINPKEYLGEQ